MNDFNSLDQKCAGMDFANLAAFEQMTKNGYEELISESQTEVDRIGFEKELEQFELAINSIKSKKAFNFISY